MKGIFPWIREALFGPPGRPIIKPPKCSDADCQSIATEACGSGLCARHHLFLCETINKKPACHHAADGRALVDLSFLVKK